MKKTQIKDSLRNVKKNILSWISIIFIAGMAAAAYLGICYAAYSMRKAGNDFYEENRFRDLEITSTLLMTDADIEALKSDSGVRDAEGIFFTNARLRNGRQFQTVNIVSDTERVNTAKIVEGSLPKAPDECAVEQSIAEKMGYKVGDPLKACSDKGGIPEFMKGTDYKITGIILHPDHLSTPEIAPGNRYIIVTPEAFDLEKLDGCYMRAEILLKETEGLNRFSPEYLKKVDSATERLEKLAEERAAARTKEFKETSQARIDENQKKLDDAKKEIDEAKEKLDEGSAKLRISRIILDESRKTIEENEEKLSDTKVMLDAVKLFLDDAEKGNLKAMEDLPPEQIEEIKAKAAEGKNEYEKNLAQYNAGVEKLKKAKEDLETGEKKYSEGLAEYEASEKKYNDGLAEYEANLAKLEDAKKELSGIRDCRWFIFNIESNAGYTHLSLSSDSISSLSITFSLFFVVIAALVIYTTIGRIVNEQRKLVGATKALGFFNREVLGKYLVFGISATVVGALIGIIVGFFIIQGVILTSYKNMYVIGQMPAKILIGTSLAGIGLAVALAVAAVTLSCMSLMRSTAMDLMREKQPKASSKEGGKSGSLYTRLIFRNMRSDLGRVIVTTVSIAGCCALLVTGFTMRNNAPGIIDKQYGEIIKYDEKLTFNPDASDTAAQDIEKILSGSGAKYIAVSSGYRAFRAGNDMEYTDLICGDISKLEEFYSFMEWKTDNAIPAVGDGVFIQCRTAESSGKNKGDEIIIYDETMDPFDVKVAGVFNNYCARNMVMSESAFEKFFHEAPKKNTYFILLNSADRAGLLEKLESVEGFEKLEATADEKERLSFVTGVFTKVALLMLAVAGLMAYFILLNITKMYVNSKQRELTVMRINGFTVKEAKNYLNRETIVTTVIGNILGVAVGALMGYIVMRFIEMPHLQFLRTPFLMGWLIGVALTVSFTAAINAFGLRKIKDLKLTDA